MMRRLLITFSLLQGICVLAAPAAIADLSVDRGLPSLLFGLSAKEVTSRFSGAGTPYQVETEGDPLDLMPLVIEEHHLTLHFDSGRVEGYESDDPTLKTTKGAHVGQTLEEVRKLHPKGAFHYGWADGSYMTYVVDIGTTSLAFQLDHADLSPTQLDKLQLKVTDKSVLKRRVVSVWVRKPIQH